MSITKELRKWWVRKFPVMDKELHEDFTAIADRIDEEHEKAIASVMNDALYHANEKDMAELGWVHLPVDADGKSIHVGDKLTHGKTSFVVEHIDLHHWGWRVIGDGIDGNGCECTAHAIPDDCHHHAPTVEDVLREFAVRVAGDECMTMRTDVIAEYAKRLQLKVVDV